MSKFFCHRCGRRFFRVEAAYCSRKCSNIANGSQRRRVDPVRVKARYAVEHGVKPWGSLSRTARAFKVTRERVRQICRSKP